MPAITDLERLIALEDIRLIRAKYCRFVDGRHFRRLKEIMTEDAVMDLTEASRPLGIESTPLYGLDNIIAQLESYTAASMLLHIVTIPEIEFTGANTATGIWRQETYVKEAKPDLPGCGIAYATAYDDYRKDADGWKIRSVRIVLELIL